MLDLLSRGRLISGFPVGTSMDTAYAYSVNPGILREKYLEGIDLDPEGVGGHGAVRLQRPLHPDALRERAAPAAAAPAPADLDPGRRLGRDVGLLRRARLRLRRALLLRPPHGQGDGRAATGARSRRTARTRTPTGWPSCSSSASADTDQEAYRLYKEPAEYFFNRSLHVYPGYADPPGYVTEASVRARYQSQVRAVARTKQAKHDLTWDEMVEKGYVVIGSPDTVRETLEDVGQDVQLRPPAHDAAVRQHERRADPLQHQALRRQGGAGAARRCSPTPRTTGGRPTRCERARERRRGTRLPLRHRRPSGRRRPRSTRSPRPGWDVVVPDLPGFDGRSGFQAARRLPRLAHRRLGRPRRHRRAALPGRRRLGRRHAGRRPGRAPARGGHRARPCWRRSASSTTPIPASTSTPCPTAERMGHLFAKGVPEPFVDRFGELGPDEGPVARYLCDVAAASLLWPLGDRGQASRLHRIALPALALWGDQDELLPVGTLGGVGRGRRAGRGRGRRRPSARMGRARGGRGPPRRVPRRAASYGSAPLGASSGHPNHWHTVISQGVRWVSSTKRSSTSSTSSRTPRCRRTTRSTPSLWVDFSNANYDPQIGHDLYHRYLSEMVLADKLGYDGLVLNEHHNTQYSMNPAPNLTAAALIPQTKGRISVFGTPPNLGYPNRLAEEYAMLDVMSGGRLRVAFPLGTGMEYWANAVNPATARARFRESIDVILQLLDRGRPAELLGRLLHLPLPEPVAQARCRSPTPSATSSAPARRRRSSWPPSWASATRWCSSRRRPS